MSEAHHDSSTTASLPNTNLPPTTNPDTETQPPPLPQVEPQTAPSPAASEPNPPIDPYTPLSSLPYTPSFEDALMSHILTSEPLPNDPSSTSTSLPAPLSVPPRSPSHTLHPLLPLPLTHPHGSPYGGPGPAPAAQSPASLAFVSSFLEAHSRIKTEAGLRKAVEREVEERVRVVKERMRAREEAVRRNAEVEREVGELEVERETERRVWERMRKEVG